MIYMVFTISSTVFQDIMKKSFFRFFPVKLDGDLFYNKVKSF